MARQTLLGYILGIISQSSKTLHSKIHTDSLLLLSSPRLCLNARLLKTPIIHLNSNSISLDCCSFLTLLSAVVVFRFAPLSRCETFLFSFHSLPHHRIPRTEDLVSTTEQAARLADSLLIDTLSTLLICGCRDRFTTVRGGLTVKVCSA
jgi:hypothetical protein